MKRSPVYIWTAVVSGTARRDVGFPERSIRLSDAPRTGRIPNPHF